MESVQVDNLNLVGTIRIIRSLISHLPSALQDSYPATMVVSYFLISLLDILGEIQDTTFRLKLTDIIMQNQVHTPHGSGFVGSIGELTQDGTCIGIVDLAMTYCSLMCLSALQNDFSRVDRSGILTHVQNLQQPDGSFMSAVEGNSADLRFTYCAAAISHVLGDTGDLNLTSACSYILTCLTYEGAFSFVPGGEANGGSTFCALAALRLLGRLEQFFEERPGARRDLIRWLVRRQVGGFQGRPNKDADSCQTFWVGASLEIMESLECVDCSSVVDFLSRCCRPSGGLGKFPGLPFDLLHTHFSLFGLSLVSRLDNICPSLIITKNATCFKFI